MPNEDARLHSFIDIFDSCKLDKIIIPMIQRDYAQGRRDPATERIREKFLESLYLALTSKPITLDFIYGDINDSGIMTPLDGQQRLTTLFLLHWYAAHKENIAPEEYKFLEKFSYETRFSAREFCARLVNYSPDFCSEESLSQQIINQSWFPLDWKKDPTIASMLVMIDAIHEKFCEINNMWQSLKDNAITFYFRPVKDIGPADELYIKMNSRGKLLTPFEQFKAEFERELRTLDNETVSRIITKIDNEWTQLLWQLDEINCNWDELILSTHEDNIADDKFLNYFRFICEVICYQNDSSPQDKNDEFDLLKKYFSASCDNAAKNISTLEKFFDCWCEIKGFNSPAEFLESFMAKEHESGKIKIRYDINIFRDCVNSYSSFTLGQKILLYAVTLYLMNYDNITREDFVRRIRIINNLIRNSEDALANRAERSRVPAIFKQVDSIMLHGVINSIGSNFNESQLQEEQEKITHLAKNPNDSEILFELEDNDLLYGQIGIIGLENLVLGKKFASLFSCSWDKIDCALMSLGDYGQHDKNKWRYQYGSSKNASAWEALFHRSASLSGFENTHNILIKLLTQNNSFTDEILQDIIDKYISQCETNKTFTWRYYYVKYQEFRPGSYGKYYNFDNTPYMFSVMQTRYKPSSSTYVPYLKEADEPHLSKTDYAIRQRLDYEKVYVICTNSCYELHDIENDALIESRQIPQNSEGIDTEDRILLLKEFLKEKGLI